MPVQDDAREREMTQLFNLTVPENRGRSDVDAQLSIDGKIINFELKSTTSSSVSTVRDFGPDHIRKWREDLHWIFAFYDRSGTRLKHCIYASPSDMEPWIANKARYIQPDLALADALPESVSSTMVTSLLGAKRYYSFDDAKWIMKNHWPTEALRDEQDHLEGYSLEAMTKLLQVRARYVILRGSTLNNPHIESGFFKDLEQIKDEHASRLRSLVRSYLASA
ncbi:hypothetical protein [Agrococcus casei]|uniref:hypothetical protein n=1 Tax=Agrococcus casei TaxID=343512 RepID=UPI003F9246E9